MGECFFLYFFCYFKINNSLFCPHLPIVYAFLIYFIDHLQNTSL